MFYFKRTLKNYLRQRDIQYRTVCSYFLPYDNVEIIRLRSELAVDLFEDGFFDYIYVDGVRSYKGVKRDLTNYFPKIKVGGYIIGDDYGWSGIATAVQEFIEAHQEELLFLENPYNPITGGQYVIKKIK